MVIFILLFLAIVLLAFVVKWQEQDIKELRKEFNELQKDLFDFMKSQDVINQPVIELAKQVKKKAGK